MVQNNFIIYHCKHTEQEKARKINPRFCWFKIIQDASAVGFSMHIIWGWKVFYRLTVYLSKWHWNPHSRAALAAHPRPLPRPRCWQTLTLTISNVELCPVYPLELATKLREVFTITEKAPLSPGWKCLLPLSHLRHY